MNASVNACSWEAPRNGLASSDETGQWDREFALARTSNCLRLSGKAIELKSDLAQSSVSMAKVLCVPEFIERRLEIRIAPARGRSLSVAFFARAGGRLSKFR
jgi:hypothetical protein